MSSVVAGLALRVAQNEALSKALAITTTDADGATIPFDLTGCTLKSQVRKRRMVTAELKAELTVTPTDEPAGLVTFSLAAADVATIAPGTYVYDVLVKVGEADPENLWTAPFVVEPGVTSW